MGLGVAANGVRGGEVNVYTATYLVTHYGLPYDTANEVVKVSGGGCKLGRTYVCFDPEAIENTIKSMVRHESALPGKTEDVGGQGNTAREAAELLWGNRRSGAKKGRTRAKPDLHVVEGHAEGLRDRGVHADPA